MARTAVDLLAMKAGSERIAMITAYDYPTARLADAAGVDAILVGDTLGMVVLGHDSTVPVTVADIVYHTRAVARGARDALVIGDMPFFSYQMSDEQAMRTAATLIQDGGARAVKLEGGAPVASAVRRIVAAGVPVMGHVGLTPQSVHALGGFKLQARTPASANRLIDDALALEDAGAFAIVLELVPLALAEAVTRRLRIPTIGIGAGPGCDGQIQVLHDLIGLDGDPERGHRPRHAGHYADVGVAIREAIRRYAADVRSGQFPAPDNAFAGSAELRAFLADGAAIRPVNPVS
ncbi:MAG: 3-methyl-2-oxobutanoate hydroxymethyltransferase [Chloroflexota bacterium]|nr:MAG: 3-methyl-2-oxobutanoate hydroxymethyltransferase [Chloroflexota bacterium]